MRPEAAQSVPGLGVCLGLWLQTHGLCSEPFGTLGLEELSHAGLELPVPGPCPDVNWEWPARSPFSHLVPVVERKELPWWTFCLFGQAGALPHMQGWGGCSRPALAFCCLCHLGQGTESLSFSGPPYPVGRLVPASQYSWEDSVR